VSPGAGLGLVHTVDRLIAAQHVRAFEGWLALVASEVRVPCARWASATVSVPARPAAPPVVVVLVGLGRGALLGLGLVHLLAWWRVRRALGPEQRGYRVLVHVVAR
jgi:hypothetical protein